MATTDTITLAVKVKSIRLYQSEDFSNVTITFDKEFEGIIRDEHGAYVEGQTNRVVMSVGRLLHYLGELDDNFALFIGCAGRVNQSALALLLTNAKFTIVRKFFAAGEVLEGSEIPVEHDGYSTAITDVKFSEMALGFMKKALDDVLPSLFRD